MFASSVIERAVRTEVSTAKVRLSERTDVCKPPLAAFLSPGQTLHTVDPMCRNLLGCGLKRILDPLSYEA
jgi:hypothetical protein